MIFIPIHVADSFAWESAMQQVRISNSKLYSLIAGTRSMILNPYVRVVFKHKHDHCHADLPIKYDFFVFRPLVAEISADGEYILLSYPGVENRAEQYRK